ncbi:hypothetical protein BZA05DRAFT_444920 [Tricharina praecox]|uniref:uncharacterized protein n=1 Tax=Tricharina praecox TaxID=43433 RepID=UPI00221FD49D|nr:uncharacterized protein BZA05DRAFT_444920 [Tricharina praecox]KAI5852391.1 hypothetical protein BZA05DRAFT_444920 [Tricharina praecox]
MDSFPTFNNPDDNWLAQALQNATPVDDMSLAAATVDPLMDEHAWGASEALAFPAAGGNQEHAAATAPVAGAGVQDWAATTAAPWYLTASYDPTFPAVPGVDYGEQWQEQAQVPPSTRALTPPPPLPPPCAPTPVPSPPRPSEPASSTLHRRSLRNLRASRQSAATTSTTDTAETAPPKPVRKRNPRASAADPPPPPPPPPNVNISLSSLPAVLPSAIRDEYEVVRKSVDAYFALGHDGESTPILVLALEEAIRVSEDAVEWLGNKGRWLEKGVVESEMQMVRAVLDGLNMV